MPETLISHIHEFEGREVSLSGWLFKKRSSGKLHFLVLRDGTGYLQAVASKKELPEEASRLCDEVTLESSVTARGIVRKDDRVPGGFELSLTDLRLLHLYNKASSIFESIFVSSNHRCDPPH